MTYEKKVYVPGAVDCYQKPWYRREYGGHIRYCGRFKVDGYDEVRLTFKPIRMLAMKIEDDVLRDEMLDLIEEMEDARYQENADHRNSLTASMWD